MKTMCLSLSVVSTSVRSPASSDDLAKARAENTDFYEVLDFYLEMIRGLHKRTYDYLGEMRASQIRWHTVRAVSTEAI